MAGNINRVIITGNLTKDPDLSSVSATGTSVCSLRVACNGRRKNSDTGQWEDQPNYFDVTVWGQQGENCAKYLSKGRPVAIDGRLRWREWKGPDEQKRQAVDIIAESVQFLGGPRNDAGNGNGFSSSAPATESSAPQTESDVPIDTGDFERTPVTAGADEDIPF